MEHDNNITGVNFRSESRTAATSKMESFVIIVNNFQPLTIMKEYSILDVSVVLDPPLNFMITSTKLYVPVVNL